MVGIVLTVPDGLLQGSSHESAPCLFHKHLGLLAELLLKEIVFLAGYCKNIITIRKGLHIWLDIVLMLKQSQGNIPFRKTKLLPRVALVNYRRNLSDSPLNVLSIRYGNILGERLLIGAHHVSHKFHPEHFVVYVT